MNCFRILGFLVASFLFLLLAQSAFSQTQPSLIASARDPQGTVLLQRSLNALVGGGSITDVTLTGTGSYIVGSDNESGTVTLKATSSGQTRVDVAAAAGTRSEVRDTSVGPPTGSWSAKDGSIHSMAKHNLMTEPAWFFPTFVLASIISNSSYAIPAPDQQTINDTAVYHMAVSQQITIPGDTKNWHQRLTSMEIFIDASSLLPVEIRMNVHPDDNASVNIPEQFVFSDYQAFGAARVPLHIQRYRNQTLLLDVLISTVNFNSGLSTSTFTLP